MKYYFTLPKTPFKNYTGSLDEIPGLLWFNGEADIDLPPNSDDIVGRLTRQCLIKAGNVFVENEDERLLRTGQFGLPEKEVPLEIPEAIFTNVVEQELNDCQQTYSGCSKVEQSQALYARLRDRHLSDRVAMQAVKILMNDINDREERLKLFGINYKNLPVIEQVIEEIKSETEQMKIKEIK